MRIAALNRPMMYLDHARIDILTHCCGLDIEAVSRALGFTQEAIRQYLNRTTGDDLIAKIEEHGVALGIISHANPELSAA